MGVRADEYGPKEWSANSCGRDRAVVWVIADDAMVGVNRWAAMSD